MAPPPMTAMAPASMVISHFAQSLTSFRASRAFPVSFMLAPDFFRPLVLFVCSYKWQSHLSSAKRRTIVSQLPLCSNAMVVANRRQHKLAPFVRQGSGLDQPRLRLLSVRRQPVVVHHLATRTLKSRNSAASCPEMNIPTAST